MKKLTQMLVLALVLSAIAGCSTIKGYISPSSSTTKKNNPTKQYCTVVQKMVKAGKGVSQVGPGTTIADATRAVKRMDDAYSDLEKFRTNNPDFNTDQLGNAYKAFKEAAPTLSGDGTVGDVATQLRAALDAYTKSMSDLVATACPSK
jgi:predicted small lipoprotein YifL